MCFVVEIFAFLGQQDVAVPIKRRGGGGQKRMVAAPFEATKPERGECELCGVFIDPRIEFFGGFGGELVVGLEQALRVVGLGFSGEVFDALLERALASEVIPARLKALDMALFEFEGQALRKAQEFALFEQPPRKRAKRGGLESVLQDQTLPKCRRFEISGDPDGMVCLGGGELKDGIEIVGRDPPRLKVCKVIRFFSQRMGFKGAVGALDGFLESKILESMERVMVDKVIKRML